VSPRRWQWLGLVLGVVVFLLIWADQLLHGPLSGADQAVYDQVGAWQDHGLPVHAVGEVVSTPVSVPWAVAITALTTIVWWVLRDRRMAAWAAGSGILAGAAIYGLKESIKRPLPPFAAGAWYKYSFPSGHTISAVANVGLLILLGAQVLVDRRGWSGAAATRAWYWAVVAWSVEAVAMGIARILTQRHWASDVYASWGVGLALACGVLLVAKVPGPAHLHGSAKPEPLPKEQETTTESGP